MCVQTITTEQDCLYLSYLNDCQPDRAYPPLRMYEEDDFLIIDADDNKQISISKTGFQVEINGDLFTDILEAQRELAIQIQCVNTSRTSSINDELVVIKEKMCDIVDGVPVDPNGIGLQNYSPTVANQAQLVDVADAERKSFVFQVLSGDCYLRFVDETTSPASRTEKVLILKDGQTFSSESSPDGTNYQGALSVINTADGNTFDFIYTKFNKTT